MPGVYSVDDWVGVFDVFEGGDAVYKDWEDGEPGGGEEGGGDDLVGS